MIDMTDMSLSWTIQQPKSMLVIVVGFGSRGIPSRVDDVRNDWIDLKICRNDDFDMMLHSLGSCSGGCRTRKRKWDRSKMDIL